MDLVGIEPTTFPAGRDALTLLQLLSIPEWIAVISNSSTGAHACVRPTRFQTVPDISASTDLGRASTGLSTFMLGQTTR